MYFQELQKKLIDLARERVRTGCVTERGLARMCAVSQPHMHNVLKNIRRFSNESADRLMRALDIRVPDLLWQVSGEEAVHVRAVPIVRNRIGPGTETIFSAFRGNLPMPGWLLEGLIEPLAARLAPDLVLPKALAANDLILLDQNPAVRVLPSGDGVWIVAEGAGLRARYLRMEGARLYVGNELTRADPQQWLSIPLQGRNILEIVRARIVWISREMETKPAGPADPAGQSDRSGGRT
ncbi:MAG: hypothetical protein ABSG41_15665 [Bryobacteraceae bacterium]